MRIRGWDRGETSDTVEKCLFIRKTPSNRQAIWLICLKGSFDKLRTVPPFSALFGSVTDTEFVLSRALPGWFYFSDQGRNFFQQLGGVCLVNALSTIKRSIPLPYDIFNCSRYLDVNQRLFDRGLNLKRVDGVASTLNCFIMSFLASEIRRYLFCKFGEILIVVRYYPVNFFRFDPGVLVSQFIPQPGHFLKLDLQFFGNNPPFS